MSARRGARSAAPTRKPPRGGGTKTTTTKRAGAAGVNHKTPEAQKARDELDTRVIGLLGQKKNKDGLGKVKIAEELGADANQVKASLNRLGGLELVETSGATMNTVYTAVEGAAGKLKEKRGGKKPVRARRSEPPAAGADADAE